MLIVFMILKSTASEESLVNSWQMAGQNLWRSRLTISANEIMEWILASPSDFSLTNCARWTCLGSICRTYPIAFVG